jgi:2-isopropylmalate synthase
MSRIIKIFDTTLRDGEQSPGCSMNLQEKMRVARQLQKLNVDVIEAGFAISSPGDFQSVQTIANEIKGPIIASLSRALTKDIDRAWEAVKNAERPRIHTFLATSDIHMQYKLKMTPEQVYNQAVEMVKYAKKYCDDVEFSAEDATRSNMDFLCKVFEGVINAGATTVNFPDTVGYITPDEFYQMISTIIQRVPNIHKADLSVHCHNDLGLAVSNSLAAIRAGATQVEGTINGIGERAGNAAIEEIVMALNTRKDSFDVICGIDTKQIYPSSRLVSLLTGQKVQANKAIVGENAFAHEAGIHQHGVIANPSTYEIMTPENIGLTGNKMVLGKHSGRHALEERLIELGYSLNEDEINAVFNDFKVLADLKKTVDERDLQVLIEKYTDSFEVIYKLDRFVINSGNTITATANMKLVYNDEMIEGVSTGDGPVDASFKAISMLTNTDFVLESYSIKAVTEGEDAIGAVDVRLEHNGHSQRGRGVSTDIIEASILAYLDAINRLIPLTKEQEEEESVEK